MLHLGIDKKELEKKSSEGHNGKEDWIKWKPFYKKKKKIQKGYYSYEKLLWEMGSHPAYAAHLQDKKLVERVRSVVLY